MKLLRDYEKMLSEEISKRIKKEDVVLIFRGQSDKSWELRSSAERRLLKSSNHLSLSAYLEKDLLVPAKNEGHGKDINDLELFGCVATQWSSNLFNRFHY